MSEIDKKWYVVRAIGGQENKARVSLSPRSLRPACPITSGRS